jgi:hypothetical protein
VEAEDPHRAHQRAQALRRQGIAVVARQRVVDDLQIGQKASADA